MAIDPAIWAQVEKEFGPLPKDGQRIRAFLHNNEVITGKVIRVWLAMDIPCIDVDYRGVTVHVMTDLGDRWEAI